MPGLLLIQPPMIGLDARNVRLRAEGARVPVLVLAREPMTRDGRWPVVGVGPGVVWPEHRRRPPGGVSVRARVDPPRPLERVEGTPTRDEAPTPEPAWFDDAIRALDDALLARVPDDVGGAERARTLVELIDAHPLGEAPYDALVEACADALDEPDELIYEDPDDDPFAF